MTPKMSTKASELLALHHLIQR